MADPPKGAQGGSSGNQPPGGGDAHESQFVRNIVKDPANVPDVMQLYGYGGASSEEGHDRLYLSPDLSTYVEVPRDAILHRMAVPAEQDPHGAVMLWVRQDAAIQQKAAPAAAALAQYFAGALAAQAAGGAAQGAQLQPAITLPEAMCPQTLPVGICPPPSPPAVCNRTPLFGCPPVTPHCPPPSPPAVCNRTPLFGCPPPSPPIVCNRTPVFACPSPPVLCLHTPHAPCPPRTPELLCQASPPQHCPLPLAPMAMGADQMMGADQIMGGGAAAFSVGCPTHPAICLHSVQILCPPPISIEVCPTRYAACQHSVVYVCPLPTIQPYCRQSINVPCQPVSPYCTPGFGSVACPSLACGGGFGPGGGGVM